MTRKESTSFKPTDTKNSWAIERTRNDSRALPAETSAKVSLSQGKDRNGSAQTWNHRKTAFDDEAPLSPLSQVPPAIPRKAPNHKPQSNGKERPQRKDTAAVHLGENTSQIPSISRESPSSTPSKFQSTHPPKMIPAERSFFDDSFDNDQDHDHDQDHDLDLDNLSVSPFYRPATSRSGGGGPSDGINGGAEWYDLDGRRPSVASASTIGSQDSITRARQKKLTGFFGEDPSVYDSPHGSDASLRTFGQQTGASANAANAFRGRNNSLPSGKEKDDGRGISPGSSRPRTPLPSSDAAPFLYQDFQDIAHFGDAPVRKGLAGPDKARFDPEPPPPANGHAHRHHRIHFPHRHTRSKEEPRSKVSHKEPSNVNPIRPSTSREDSGYSIRTLQNSVSAQNTPFSSHTALNTFPSSSTLSNLSTFNGTGFDGNLSSRTPTEGSNGITQHKKSLRILRGLLGNKGEKGSTDNLKGLPGSTKSLVESGGKAMKGVKFDAKGGSRNPSVATMDSSATIRPFDASDRKESKVRGHNIFTTPAKKIVKEDMAHARDERLRTASQEKEGLWALDTDLDHMEGIVSNQHPQTPPHGGIFVGSPTEDEFPKEQTEAPPAGTTAEEWNAPDSWAVKRIGDENLARLGEVDETGLVPRADDNIAYCVRVFRVDSTFATLSTNLNITVADILQILGKKSFLQDELNNYHIHMKKQGLQRQLGSSERPIAIQKRLMEQAGYQESDRIEEIGREDISYLCRFTFVPTKLGGFYTLDRDSGFDKLQKFSHVDLSGKSLITIPILLYKRAVEIITINLSKNLSIEVPGDFIQSCVNLREIKYISNEAWQLPSSLSEAARLTMLDISNNRLEQLGQTELEKLTMLISLKAANNKLSTLPDSFSKFRSLRHINVSSNYLSTFPECLYKIETLTELDISFNTIKELPELGRIKSLEKLLATNNEITGPLPDSFKQLENLRELDMRFNGITNINVVSHLPRLESVAVGHNAISRIEGAFARCTHFAADHNPVTRFTITGPMPCLASLHLASGNITQLDDGLYEKMPNLVKLIIDKNHFTKISAQLGRLRKLEHLSIAKNPLTALPATIGNLTELRILDVRECNLQKLPPEIWCCVKLDTLNVSSNVLESFPKPSANLAPPNPESVSTNTPALPVSPSNDDLAKIEEFGHRRPSQASGGLLSVGSSPAGSTRKGSIVSVYGPGGRKASVISRTPTEGAMSPVIRKDSNISTRMTTTFAGTLRHLYLADNRLTDDIFEEITLLPELRILNLSWNDLYDIPPRSLRRWTRLNELYLSGNELTSLPSDDLEEISTLKVLHLNSNRFHTLPAELGKVSKLSILDVGSNVLKYNISNWPYDWNWNWNRNLKYLNFSGNKRLEVKPNVSSFKTAGREETDLTDFSTLKYLRVLGLMDVTLTITKIPEETENRRVRTSGSSVGSLPYGMADTLGKFDHMSTIDMVVPRYRGHESEILLGMFDGQALASGGSKIAKFLHENFTTRFSEELDRMRNLDTPCDALRRTFLALNKDLATAAGQSVDERIPKYTRQGSVTARSLTPDDLNSGGVATVLFLDNMELYVANVGDAEALLLRSDGGHVCITRKHNPADKKERERIREAGGYVSRQGKVNDTLDISRAFGYISMIPAITAAPYTARYTLGEQDELILLASRELWDYLTPDLVVDIARSERTDPMRGAQKLRDLAIAFGASGKIMVMIIGISDLKRRERNRYRGQTLSMGPTQLEHDYPYVGNKTSKGRRNIKKIEDSNLARLDDEVPAPEGFVALVFTDIKSSTLLWETYPVAMRTAIKIHNFLMRRQLRIIGGYEVKTEGDAFMVSFPTATSALLWCFSMQSHLVDADWPSEILNSIHGQEILDADGIRIYRGLSVRMGVHWGAPVCEKDPVTQRMDYFGPIVNRAARISAKADGGEITVSQDFLVEIQRTLETYADTDRSSSIGSDDTMTGNGADDAMGMAIRRELRALSSQGFEVKDLGEMKLKGLENPEYIYQMYPHALAGRLMQHPARVDADAVAESSTSAVGVDGGETHPGSLPNNTKLSIDVQNVWDLWAVSLRLEMLCSSLEKEGQSTLKAPETALLEKMKSRGGEVTDRFLVDFVEHQVSRIETCITTLMVRHMVRPFSSDRSLLDQAVPMADILGELTSQLAQARATIQAAH